MALKTQKNYYTLLGVDINASENEIKFAFRKKAIELHPDRNPSQEATEQFQFLNEAYNVLSDSGKRAHYDKIWFHSYFNNKNPGIPESHSQLIICSCCAKIAAQPRYAVYYEIKSFLLKTKRHFVNGIFCHQCGEKKVLRATLITWLMGWWGLPWGPIYSLQAIAANLMGGKQPAEANARIIAHQAQAFYAVHEREAAHALAGDALEFIQRSDAKNNTEIKNELDLLRHEMAKILNATKRAYQSEKDYKKVWSYFNRAFWLQALIILIVGVAVYQGLYGYLGDQPKLPPIELKPRQIKPDPVLAPPLPKPPAKVVSEPKVDVKEKINSKPVKVNPPKPKIIPAPTSTANKNVRPSYADNGAPWPKISDYVTGYPNLLANGQSTITIDNSKNDIDMFVKIFLLGPGKPQQLRVIYVRAHGQFNARKFPSGAYDIRYRELNSGKIMRTQPFKIEEKVIDTNIKPVRVKIPLYTSQQRKTDLINNSEFGSE